MNQGHHMPAKQTWLHGLKIKGCVHKAALLFQQGVHSRYRYPTQLRFCLSNKK